MVLTRRDGILFFGILLIDQLTKALARDLKPHNWLFRLIAPNTGAGFGILRGQHVLLIIAAILVLAILWRPFTKSKGHDRIALALLMGGIAGNLVDRLVFGAVTDFIDIFGSFNFPVFNVADAAITLTVLYFIGKAMRQTYHSWQFTHRSSKSKR